MANIFNAVRRRTVVKEDIDKDERGKPVDEVTFFYAYKSVI